MEFVPLHHFAVEDTQVMLEASTVEVGLAQFSSNSRSKTPLSYLDDQSLYDGTSRDATVKVCAGPGVTRMLSSVYGSWPHVVCATTAPYVPSTIATRANVAGAKSLAANFGLRDGPVGEHAAKYWFQPFPSFRRELHHK